jgi:Zn-dependent peptidase ImmA (M78 family)
MLMIDKARIENAASVIYAKHFQRGSPAKMLAKIIKAEGIKLREVDGGENFLGALVKSPKGVYYITVNKNITNDGRKNFTTAHELGHFVLGHHLHTASFFCSESEITEDGAAANDQENEANYFASCFLLPWDRVTTEFTAWFSYKFPTSRKTFLFVNPKSSNYRDWKAIDSKLTDKFGVSTAALKIRLVELGLINSF